MSQLRLLILLTFILAYSICQAQKNSSGNLAVDSLSSKINKSEKVVNTVTSNLDTLVKNATSTPLNQVFKTNAVVTKINQKADSALIALQQLPNKYFKKVDKKIDKYSNRLTSKTEKTLTKLSRWENKIKKLLDEASPQTSAKLFGPNQVTFTSLLQKLKNGENIAKASTTKYDGYRDKLTTSLKYVQSQKSKLDSNIIKPASDASGKMKELNQDVANSDQVQKIIKERKKQLINESIKYIGKSKYLSKINKESYYYVETLKNYKEIFSDPDKTEKTVKTILNSIPAFKKFFQQNSMLASLFGSSSSEESTASLSGLQTRDGINDLIRGKIAAGGPNASAEVQQSMQQGQAEMKSLKDKVLKAGGSNGNTEIPDFKPNKQKSKTFVQRLEYGFDYQFGKSNKFLPSTTDLSLTVGYKLNDESIVGIGITYKLGLGVIDKIRFTNQGIGFKSYIDWKLKKQFFVSGGFEMNYNSGFKNVAILKNCNAWQQSGLIGISKKINLKTKFTKGTKLSLLYDILNKQHIPVSQPIVFRIGYTF